ncbi:MAG TPA: hypothetical protein ENK02_04950 [Planctomycetes bacterium]|nr:hypothetical protein [Planctomycetota bacterium]
MTREWILQPGTSRKGGILGGLISLSLVALGLFVVVGLVQSRFALGGSAALSDIGGLAGFFQGGFGWIPSFYFAILLLIWGGFSFVEGELSNPLKRILASVCFMFFFAGLVGSLGGDGGSMGKGASASMGALIGKVPSAVFFAALTLLGLFLATDWFFYKGFKRFLIPGDLLVREDMGLEGEEERLLLGMGPGVGQSAGKEAEAENDAPPAKPLTRRAEKRIEKRVEKRGEKNPERELGTERSIRSAEPAGRSVEKLGEAAPAQPADPVEVRLDRVLQQARTDLDEEPAEVFVFHDEAEDEPEDLPDDLFSTLENESLLEAAGKALDKILEEEAPRFRQTTLEDMNEVVLEPQPRVQPRPVEDAAPKAEQGATGREGPAKEDGQKAAPSAETSSDPKIEIYKAHDATSSKDSVPSQALLFPESPPDPQSIHRAAQILLTSRRPVPSLLQRRMGISLAEAREIFARLQELGALAEPQGRGPWEPLMTLPEWEEVKRLELGETPQL